MIEETQWSSTVPIEGAQASHRLLMSTGTGRFAATPEAFILSQTSLVNFPILILPIEGVSCVSLYTCHYRFRISSQ